MDKINEKSLDEIGYQAALAFSALMDGFLKGCADYRSGLDKAKASDDKSEDDGTPDEIPEECRACWCHECKNFEECIVEKEGYSQDQKPCTCDGCYKGNRYMPKEKPPTCGKYAASKENDE